MRILIIEVNWLGDVLFSTPFIRAIREKFKDSYIACLTVPWTKEVLEHNPWLDEIIIYDEKSAHRSLFGKACLVSELRKKKFDTAILLHRSFTRTILAFLSGIKERVGYVTEKRRVLLTRPVEPPDAPLHKVEYFLRIADSLGCDTSKKDYEFFITDKERRYIEEGLKREGVQKKDFLVLVNPGANWLPKRWSEENFAKLGDTLIGRYGVKIAISGAEKDMAIANRIRSNMKEKVIVFAGRTNLKELGALMERANVVISGDSGPMHIAVAMKSNVLALFGPTSPELTGPYGSGNYKVISRDVGCEIPCYDLSCVDTRCMDAITVEDVLGAFEEIYRK